MKSNSVQEADAFCDNPHKLQTTHEDIARMLLRHHTRNCIPCKKNRSELPPSERSFHIGSKTRTEKMSNVSPRSAYSFIPGKSLRMGFVSHAHRSPQDRSCNTVCMEKEKPLPHGVQNGLFRYRYSVPDMV